MQVEDPLHFGVSVLREHIATHEKADRHSDHGVEDDQRHTAKEAVHIRADQDADQVGRQNWQGHEHIEEQENQVELDDVGAGLLLQVRQQVDQMLLEQEGEHQREQARE